VRGSAIKVYLQGPSLHLARHDDERPAFKLKPDIVIKRDGQVACILDTKWKRLKPEQANDGVSSADIYQMHAYASRYDAPNVILLYPHYPVLGEQKACRNQCWLSGPNGQSRERRIAISTVDLTNLATIPRQLELAMSL
jgi:5-methylcytosine-specific restriction enzyme subunit McrC